MTRYDLIIFDVQTENPDSIAIMYESGGGRYVNASDADKKIECFKRALMNLRDCNSSLNTKSDLNGYVDFVLEACK